MVKNNPIRYVDYLGLDPTSSQQASIDDKGYYEYKDPKGGGRITVVGKCKVVVFYGHGIDTLDADGNPVDFSKMTASQASDVSGVPVTVKNEPCSAAEVYGCNTGNYSNVESPVEGAANPKTNVDGPLDGASIDALWARAKAQAKKIGRRQLSSAQFLCIAE
jgi:hypothetical protein